MIDPRSIQSSRGRSLILWQGKQWSVTNNGVETTDPSVPHIIIPPEHLDRVEQVIDGNYSPLLPHGAEWFDIQEFIVIIDRASVIHHRNAGSPKELLQGRLSKVNTDLGVEQSIRPSDHGLECRKNSVLRLLQLARFLPLAKTKVLRSLSGGDDH
jgi:hypothetical protein